MTWCSTPAGSGCCVTNTGPSHAAMAEVGAMRFDEVCVAQPAANNDRAARTASLRVMGFSLCGLQVGYTEPQHPAVHLPLPSNSIILPESGTYTGTCTALMNFSVRVPGRTLPAAVAPSFACETITCAGFTS